MAACRPFEEPAGPSQRPRYGLNFGRNLGKRNVSFPATPDFNAARAGMCARPKRGASYPHTLGSELFCTVPHGNKAQLTTSPTAISVQA